MSKFSELDYEIQELYIEGYKPQTIASRLNISVDLVYSWLEQESVEGIAFDPYETINS